MVNSNAKGGVGERELAEKIRSYDFEARRSQQYEGTADSEDLKHNIENVHIECKYAAWISLYKALQQAITDMGPNKIPVVAYRQIGKNIPRRPWVAIMLMDDFLDMQKELIAYRKADR